ncbi:hypothetical protein D9V28_08740 [Mycetocola zhadangensis]|uniref:Uncharacterized protein n=2 Tax=Mycetocola zhadangensis TaxID=1164595 RepID=A0A3L7J1D5_9MICO|nr:hypothetical protein D9V28_08740 [Mycetocola zhadangensis]
MVDVVRSAVLGFLAGLVWFVVLSYSEGARVDSLTAGDTLRVIPVILISIAVSAVAIWAISRLRTAFGIGTAVGLIVLALIGLIVGDLAMAFANPILLPFPSLFSRGASAISVWIAVVASLIFASPTKRRNPDVQRAEEQPRLSHQYP